MRSIKSNPIIVAATFIMLLIAGIALVMITPEKEKIKKNVAFSFRNTSFGKEKIPCQVKLNDTVFINSIDFSTIKDTSITLPIGIHKIEVTTLDGKFSTSENLTIMDSTMTYVTTQYSYSPGYDEYLPFYKELYFSRIVKENNTEEEKDLIRKQIDENITIETLKKNYKPIDRRFEISIKNHKDIII